MKFIVSMLTLLGAGAVLSALSVTTTMSQESMNREMPNMMTPDLMMPVPNLAHGRRLFADKGCVLCHVVNDIGGTDASPLDALAMKGMTNPFEFVANMWRGAGPMLKLQEEELGGQVDFTGQELADIVGFLHSSEEQKKLSESEFPENIRSALARMKTEGSDGTGEPMKEMK
ncbi:MAG: hypothetical protein IT541_11485 [Hyphomicrobiales bacterium]|nr:hypothetical protein [Hyphomicrobiales bacterium]